MKIKSWDITLRDVPGTTSNGRSGAFDGNTVQATENDEFYTTDTEAFLIFNLLDEDFRTKSATITLYNRTDGSVVNEDVPVASGVIEYEMRHEVIEHAGAWQAQLVYEQDKDGVPEKYTSKVVSFGVSGHLLDTKLPALVIIENWDNFLLSAESLIEDWEQNEALRAAAEQERDAAEDSRVSEENKRVSAESDRESAEGKRASTFTYNENSRKTEFESNEADRQTNESDRNANETDRESNESVRKSNESDRESNEVDRQSQEGSREIAETARQEAYGDSIDTLAASAEEAKESAAKAQQAMKDYLSMLGEEIATLGADGKLSANQLPALAINDTHVVHSKEEIVALVAERGDVAVLVHDENVSDAYILTVDEPNVLDNWIKLGVSYVAKAGHAETATVAVDSQKINGHRVVALSEEEYNLGAKDPETVYLVGDL